TPVGVLAIPASPHLTPGARVALEVVSVTPPAAQSAVGAVQAGAAPTPSAFPALSEAMDLLARLDPAAAERLADGLPQANNRLAANMLVFAAALRANTPRAAFGEQPLKALERVGGREAVKRLTEELAEKAGQETKPANAPVGGEWRVATLPFLSGAEIDPIRLSLRRPPDAEETDDEREKKGRGDPGARFLVDLSLTRIGPVQLDGLVKRKSKRFDLILRTRAALDGDTRAAVTQIFAKACAELQMAGQVTFQATTRFVEPLLPEQAVRGLTV
ncbi:MAG: hypothetical protein HQL40_16440, partial [Alphaproteobacteria bacterium]|nr:hypothetical protein [Alphaproteobacteria bacterium]